MTKIEMSRVIVQALYALKEPPLAADHRVKRVMRQDVATVKDRYKTAQSVLSRIATVNDRHLEVHARAQAITVMRGDRTEARPVIKGAMLTASDAELLDIYRRAHAACLERGLDITTKETD